MIRVSLTKLAHGVIMTQERPDPTIAREIDENLRKVYEDVLKEEVPDRFKNLLDQLRAQKVPPLDGGS